MGAMAIVSPVGSVAPLWACKNWQARPARFDPDMDVVEVELRNQVYAAEFKRANRDATASAVTEPLPCHRRSVTCKTVVTALFVFVTWRLVRQA